MLNNSIKSFFKFYNYSYHYIFLSIFIFSFIIIFSPYIGLGSGDTFLLFKLFGIFRSTALFTLIYGLLFCFIVLALIKLIHTSDKETWLNIEIQKSSIRISILFLFCVSCLKFLIDGYRFQFNAFKWTAFTNFPALVNNIYDGVLQYDFFTNAIIDTPRFIIQYALLIPSKIGIGWYDGIYLYDVVVSIIYMPVIFLCFNTIINKFCIKKDEKLSKIIFFHFIIFIIIASDIIISMQHDFSLLGWDSAFHTLDAEADDYALLVGLFYLHFNFTKNFPFRQNICILLLAICTLIHLVIGLAIFSIMLLYYLSLRNTYYSHHLLLQLLIGILFPIIFLLLYYENPNPLDAEKFINIYNLTSHAFHYKISELIGWTFIKWLCFYFLLLLISIRMKDSILMKLSILSLAFFILPPIFQYFGTEFWKIKLFGILGINRFSAFNTFVFCLNMLIIFGRSKFFDSISRFLNNVIIFIKSELEIVHSNIELSIIHHIKSFIIIMSKNLVIIISIIIITLSAVWAITLHDPLDNQININPRINNQKLETLDSLCNWIQLKTPKNSIFFINEKNNIKNIPISFAIKCFGHRATFVDYAFPFNESKILEWEKRLNYYNNFNSLPLKDIIEMAEEYSVTHFLMKNNKDNKFKSYNHIWKSEEFIIYDIKEF